MSICIETERLIIRPPIGRDLILANKYCVNITYEIDDLDKKTDVNKE